ncbi:MAG TPA: hypothetical protein VJQ08_05855 [Candidatus Dormibacteraeota bacterium]|nr:hypothetical protein [Candidatus Dormibacteraeota bacterium]
MTGRKTCRHAARRRCSWGGEAIRIRPRHVTDPDEARAVSGLIRNKYGAMVRASKSGEPPTLAEQATFELVPVE